MRLQPSYLEACCLDPMLIKGNKILENLDPAQIWCMQHWNNSGRNKNIYYILIAIDLGFRRWDCKAGQNPRGNFAFIVMGGWHVCRLWAKIYVESISINCNLGKMFSCIWRVGYSVGLWKEEKRGFAVYGGNLELQSSSQYKTTVSCF